MPNSGLGTTARESREFLHNRVRQHHGEVNFGSRREQRGRFRKHLAEHGESVSFRGMRAAHRQAAKARFKTYGQDYASMKKQKSASFKAEQATKKSKRSRRREKRAGKKAG